MEGLDLHPSSKTTKGRVWEIGPRVSGRLSGAREGDWKTPRDGPSLVLVVPHLRGPHWNQLFSALNHLFMKSKDGQPPRWLKICQGVSQETLWLGVTRHHRKKGETRVQEWGNGTKDLSGGFFFWWTWDSFCTESLTKTYLGWFCPSISCITDCLLLVDSGSRGWGERQPRRTALCGACGLGQSERRGVYPGLPFVWLVCE